MATQDVFQVIWALIFIVSSPLLPRGDRASRLILTPITQRDWHETVNCLLLKYSWSGASSLRGWGATIPASSPSNISMTKHWGGPGLLAPPVITLGAGAQRDHHLDCRTSYSSSNPSCHCSTNPLLEFGGRLDKSTTGMAQDSCYRAKPSDQSAWELQDGNSSGGKKKNYQRYPKPPYSYLAMIAMVIQNSPEKKLTLSEVGHFHMHEARNFLFFGQYLTGNAN